MRPVAISKWACHSETANVKLERCSRWGLWERLLDRGNRATLNLFLFLIEVATIYRQFASSVHMASIL